MTAVLKRIDDPRSNLERARRTELVAYAQANGMTDIHENVPAIIIRRRLIERGLTRVPVQAQTLGMPAGAGSSLPPADGPVTEVDAEADLERQYAMQAAAPVSAPVKNPNLMGINELRAECKRLKIKLSRRDNMTTMKAKIEGHGKQDAA